MPKIRYLKLTPYEQSLAAMREFTHQRSANTEDELWLVQHPPVFTQGQAGKPEHVLNSGDIPLVQSDRGGQVTYHGPGQIVVYFLVDLQRMGIGIRSLVMKIEQSVIGLLADYGIEAYGKRDAPGIYVNEAKIGSIGMRVRRGHTYHGLAFNVDMDLEPFSRINPCGFSGLKVTQLSDFIDDVSLELVQEKLIGHFYREFGYNARQKA